MQILDIRADTPQWLEARRDGIGASEVAAILGLSPFESPFSLWWRKVERWDIEVTPAMEWGHRLEPAVAGKFADAHPDLYVEDGAFVAGPDAWMLATPDRFVFNNTLCELHGAVYCPTCMPNFWVRPAAVLELKTGFPGEHWGETGSADIPIHYRCQVQWQMLCADVGTAYVAALLGGSDYREYVIRRDDADIAIMVEAASRFRQSIVDQQAPPLDAHTATLATLRKLHPDVDGSTAIVPEQLARAYLRSVRFLRLAKRVRDRYEARLRAAMGAAQRAETAAGMFVASRSVFDVDAAVIDRRGYTQDRINAPRIIDALGRSGR